MTRITVGGLQKLRSISIRKGLALNYGLLLRLWYYVFIRLTYTDGKSVTQSVNESQVALSNTLTQKV